MSSTTNSKNIPSEHDERQVESAQSVPRFQHAQVDRCIIHPLMPQPPPPLATESAQQQQQQQQQHRNDCGTKPLNTTGVDINNDVLDSVQPTTMSHTFVIAADTQLGMTNENRSWDIEIEFSRQAVERINALRPRPLYCCICGDLVDMCSDIYSGKPKRSLQQQGVAVIASTTTVAEQEDVWTEVECDMMQEQQNNDMKQIWYNLHPDIALICLCGNHDVGNRPTQQSIQKFNSSFGDDYLAFWANGTYNVVLNSALFSDPTGAIPLYAAQLHWLEQQLRYANRYSATHIFVFSHHPWFLYDEHEDVDDLPGISYLIPGNTEIYVSDSYFPIPKVYRQQVMKLFEHHNVTACFAGHFHQNVISQSTFGMKMIITGALSMVLESTENSNVRNEPSTQGFRIVTVQHDPSRGKGVFHHRFVNIGAIEE